MSEVVLTTHHPETLRGALKAIGPMAMADLQGVDAHGRLSCDLARPSWVSKQRGEWLREVESRLRLPTSLPRAVELETRSLREPGRTVRGRVMRSVLARAGWPKAKARLWGEEYERRGVFRAVIDLDAPPRVAGVLPDGGLVLACCSSAREKSNRGLI